MAGTRPVAFNMITAKPVLEEFQANAQLTYGNYDTVKAKGMVNVPLGEIAALRLAGSYLTRDGFATNEATGNEVDDLDLYSIRATLAVEPTDRLRGSVSYEHFEEDDSRLRFGRQVCDKDPTKTSFMGIPIIQADQVNTSQGCLGGQLILTGLGQSTNSLTTLTGGLAVLAGLSNGDIYTIPSSTDLRTGFSQFDPDYQAEQTLISWKGEFDLTDSLSLTYLGSYFESEIFQRNTFGAGEAGVPYNDLSAIPPGVSGQADFYNALLPGGFVTDPQLGVSNFSLSSGSSGTSQEATSHELRLQSDFDGRFNFNLGANCVVSAQGYEKVLGAIAAGTPNPMTGIPLLSPGAPSGICSGQLAGLAGLLGVPDVSFTNAEGQTVTVGGLTPFSGDAIDVSGNSIPNAPDSKLNIGDEYTWDSLRQGAWDLSARADYYVQSESFSRVWNTRTDELESWSNLNLSLRLTNADHGFDVEAFGKNVTDEEVITGHSLGDDSVGLTTNIFLTEPATYGITVAKT